MKEIKQKEVINDAENIIEKYCVLYNAIRTKGFNEVSASDIFKQVSIELRQTEKNDTSKPTQKQIEYAQNLKILNPESMTRQELSNAIDNKLKGN